MKRISLFLILVTWSLLAVAEVVRVQDIRLNGLQRVSAGTVFSALPIQVGDLVDDEGIRQATRSLFLTGYFDDIQIAFDEGALIILVAERPAVAELKIEGNKAISEEDLLKALRENGVDEGQIFKESILDGMSRELERQYVAQGRYGATVETEVEDLPKNRVAINITVDEGDVAKIKHINIVGNEDFEEGDLRDLFELNTTGWLSWIFGDDKYSKEKLGGDLERLESWYRDRGYLAFNITSTQVSISPDKEGVFITINIDEGDIYTVGNVELAGDLVVEEELIRPLILLKEGDVFSDSIMVTSKDFITKLLGNKGYTFAEVQTFPQIKEGEQVADLTFFINPGKRAYVRRIEFRGNTKTIDEVLRREMRQFEGGSATTSNIEFSKVRLERLGYFKEVEVETVPVPGTNDQLDVIYTVEEQPSGSIGASVGFAQDFGLVLGANLQENNFLGTGKKVGVSINRSEFRTNIGFNYTEPYFTEDGVSAGFNVFARSSDYEEINISSYQSDSFGASVNFSYPLSEISRIGVGFGYENLSLDEGFAPSFEISDFIAQNGDSYNLFSANANWVRSTLNRGVLANRGTSNKVQFEVVVPGSDLEYYKLTYAGQWYYPLTRSLTLKLRTDLGYADSFGDTSRVPFLKNFYSGGFGSVRGFQRNTLGPQDTPPCLVPVFGPDPDGGPDEVQTGSDIGFDCDADGAIPYDDPDPFGGNVLVEMGAEVLFPLPFIKDQRSLQASLFFDAGNVFDTNCGEDQFNCFEPELGELRYSVGVGVVWISGFGPITVSFAKPLNSGEFDEEESFQFSLGQTF